MGPKVRLADASLWKSVDKVKEYLHGKSTRTPTSRKSVGSSPPVESGLCITFEMVFCFIRESLEPSLPNPAPTSCDSRLGADTGMDSTIADILSVIAADEPDIGIHARPPARDVKELIPDPLILRYRYRVPSLEMKKRTIPFPVLAPAERY